jgi:hypothetical protein
MNTNTTKRTANRRGSFRCAERIRQGVRRKVGVGSDLNRLDLTARATPTGWSLTKGTMMKRRTARLATTVLVAGSLGLAALGLGAGIANAGGPYQWCPGQSQHVPGGALDEVNWDWSVCHTYWVVRPPMGNVTPGIWDGDTPPADNPCFGLPCGLFP